MSKADEAPVDPKVEIVVEAGRRLGIEVRPVSFDRETRTAADAARQVGCHVAQIVKSLVFEADRRPILLLVSGANRVDLAKGAAAAGVDALDKADADAARAASGFSIGATPPFGHATDIPVFMDADLLGYDEVWAAAGRPDTVFNVSPTKLQEATGGPAVDLRADLDRDLAAEVASLEADERDRREIRRVAELMDELLKGDETPP